MMQTYVDITKYDKTWGKDEKGAVLSTKSSSIETLISVGNCFFFSLSLYEMMLSKPRGGSHFTMRVNQTIYMFVLTSSSDVCRLFSQ